MIAATLLAVALSTHAAATPDVIKAALDHHLEKKCKSGWATMVTAVSDSAIRFYGNLHNARPYVSEAMLNELTSAPAGAWLDLPKMFFPFRAANGPDDRGTGPNEGGIISFSVPIFDSSGDAAVIYMNHYCGNLCAEGNLLYVERKAHGWVVTRDIPLWIS